MKQIAIAILCVGSDITYWYAKRHGLMGDLDKALNTLILIGLLGLFLYSLSWP